MSRNIISQRIYNFKTLILEEFIISPTLSLFLYLRPLKEVRVVLLRILSNIQHICVCIYVCAPSRIHACTIQYAFIMRVLVMVDIYTCELNFHTRVKIQVLIPIWCMVSQRIHASKSFVI